MRVFKMYFPSKYTFIYFKLMALTFLLYLICLCPLASLTVGHVALMNYNSFTQITDLNTFASTDESNVQCRHLNNNFWCSLLWVSPATCTVHGGLLIMKNVPFQDKEDLTG